MAFTLTENHTYIPNTLSSNALLYNEFDKTGHMLIQSQIQQGNFNGRINLMEPQDANVIFKMQEKIAIKNKSTPYREALAGTWEDNLMSKAYFSEKNVQILQNGLRAGVYEMSDQKHMISPQNVDTLKIIMRSIYLQHAKHYVDNITEQIKELNKLVLEYAVPTVYKEVIGYVKYLEDQSTIAMPLSMPKHHDRQYKQLELKNYF